MPWKSFWRLEREGQPWEGSQKGRALIPALPLRSLSPDLGKIWSTSSIVAFLILAGDNVVIHCKSFPQYFSFIFFIRKKRKKNAQDKTKNHHAVLRACQAVLGPFKGHWHWLSDVCTNGLQRSVAAKTIKSINVVLWQEHLPPSTTYPPKYCALKASQLRQDGCFLSRWLTPWSWLSSRQEAEGEEAISSGQAERRSPSSAGRIPRTSDESPQRDAGLSRTPMNYPNMHSVPLMSGQVSPCLGCRVVDV